MTNIRDEPGGCGRKRRRLVCTRDHDPRRTSSSSPAPADAAIKPILYDAFRRRFRASSRPCAADVYASFPAPLVRRRRRSPRPHRNVFIFGPLILNHVLPRDRTPSPRRDSNRERRFSHGLTINPFFDDFRKKTRLRERYFELVILKNRNRCRLRFEVGGYTKLSHS